MSVCKTQAVPYGVTLIMAPWNYPFLLTLEPLAGALAAGNTVVIKPSAYAPASSAVLRRICEETFDPRLVTVVEGGRAENEALLDECWDKIFFTGSVPVGKLVMERASKNLTPVTLELGGKSPCIVDATANLKVSKELLEGFYHDLKDYYQCLFSKDIYSQDWWLEILPKKATKAHAILQLKEYLNCDKVVVFGDGLNDLSMFEIADESYAVENACRELKEKATGVIGHHDQESVAQYLKENYKG